MPREVHPEVALGELLKIGAGRGHRCAGGCHLLPPPGCDCVSTLLSTFRITVSGPAERTTGIRFKDRYPLSYTNRITRFWTFWGFRPLRRAYPCIVSLAGAVRFRPAVTTARRYHPRGNGEDGHFGAGQRTDPAQRERQPDAAGDPTCASSASASTSATSSPSRTSTSTSAGASSSRCSARAAAARRRRCGWSPASSSPPPGRVLIEGERRRRPPLPQAARPTPSSRATRCSPT